MTRATPARRGFDIVFFVYVTLARPRPCEACGRDLGPGAKAHLVVRAGGGAHRVRCTDCFANGREPTDIGDSTMAPSSSLATTDGTLATISPIAWIGAGALAALAGLLASRGVRRFFVTAAVGIKTAARLAWARLTGHRDRAPHIVRTSFEELGPTYIKLGQLVASSQGLFPEPYCVEFQKCLDRVKPFGFEDALRIVRDELGRDPGEVFAEIDEVPLASASIAQVHGARLKSGEDVVIKVQRPRIDVTVEADLRVLKAGARLFAMLPHGELANPMGIVEDFEANIHEELDFVREAANMDEFNRIMLERGQVEVAAPKVFHDLTTKRILVMERFYGHRVDDVERLRAADVDGEAKLLLGMRAWFQCMIFNGFFHGDVHAGNLMALRDGRIGFLDFGIVGRFLPERRAQVIEYLMSFASGDFKKLAEVMIAMGAVDGERHVAGSADLDALAKDLKEAYEPMLGSAMESIKYADMIPAIMRTSVKHKMRLPRDFVLITKQMLYFDRYAKILAPKLNIFRDPRIVSAMATDVMMARMLPTA